LAGAWRRKKKDIRRLLEVYRGRRRIGSVASQLICSEQTSKQASFPRNEKSAMITLCASFSFECAYGGTEREKKWVQFA